jgi:hypothetical protein
VVSGGSEGAGIARRLERLNWSEITASLDELGYARTPVLLTERECRALVALYGVDERFRSTIDMVRYRFGIGEYRYFDYPLPGMVAGLRAQAYSRLAPIANRWAQELGQSHRYPRELERFLKLCRSKGQSRPTPLLLRYRSGGYNCLHQDVYGPLAFPLQMTCFLSRPEVDYGGGEFLVVEQRPRSQSRGEAIRAEQGEAIIFANAQRPVSGARGKYRVNMRHGVSRVTWGERFALGLIFHEAR